MQFMYIYEILHVSYPHGGSLGCIPPTCINSRPKEILKREFLWASCP